MLLPIICDCFGIFVVREHVNYPQRHSRAVEKGASPGSIRGYALMNNEEVLA
jgi:hypothetical protein